MALAAFGSLGSAQSTNTGPVVKYSATTANVSGAPSQVRIDLLRWSTDEERNELVTAWTTPKAPEPQGGRGRGRGGRGGRGGGDAEPALPPAPKESLATALGSAPTVGYVWPADEVAGYSVKYAVRLMGSSGGERIILITDRRLGRWNNQWKPTSGTANDYAFSLVELRLNQAGEGEGKVSLTGSVTADRAANSLVLENYDALPAVLTGISQTK